MYDSAVAYLNDVSPDDTVLVLHHWDMDGSAAAAIVSKLLERVRGTPADMVHIPEGRKHRVGERAERLIREDGVDRLIVLDMNDTGARLDALHAMGPDVLVIDHHNVETLPEHAVVVNPRIEDAEAYVPAAKLCNDIAAEMGVNLDWVAGLGVVQDFAVDGHEQLFRGLRDEYPDYFPDEITQHTMAKECRYGKISSILNIKPYKDSDRCAQVAHDTLFNATGLEQLEMQDGFQILEGYYQEMYEEIEAAVEHFEEEKEVYEDEKLVYFRFSSEFHINSSIATRISLDREDWVHVIVNVQDDRANVSARCQSGRVNLGTVLQDALPADVDGEAGGHRNAAGASLPASALDRFKDRLRDRL